MPFTEFYCQTTGSNLNAGSTTTDAATLTYASGTWVAGTGVFTVASGDPASDGVAVGDWASVYPDGSSVGVFVGRVTARAATTITVSLTAKSGTAPTDGTGNRTVKIGGAWKGPNGAEGFPFGFAAGTMTNASADAPRVNFKSGTTYNITALMTHNVAGPTWHEGYTTTPGDGGRAIIDGGTSGAAYGLLTVSSSANHVGRILFQNNGATGNANGVTISSASRLFGVVVTGMRGNGIGTGGGAYSVVMDECESYNCNISATAGQGGIMMQNNGVAFLRRCISHDHTGSSNKHGFVFFSTAVLIDCIADTCGGAGVQYSSTAGHLIARGCDFYATNDGIRISGGSGSAQLFAENCNFTDSTAYGINGSGAVVKHGQIHNCGFGTGTAANASGDTNTLGAIQIAGSVTYAADVTPWVDPANGDFRINLAAAKGTGRGTFTQTAASYAGTVGYPDIGAAQHLETPSGGGVSRGRMI